MPDEAYYSLLETLHIAQPVITIDSEADLCRGPKGGVYRLDECSGRGRRR